MITLPVSTSPLSTSYLHSAQRLTCKADFQTMWTWFVFVGLVVGYTDSTLEIGATSDEYSNSVECHCCWFRGAAMCCFYGGLCDSEKYCDGRSYCEFRSQNMKQVSDGPAYDTYEFELAELTYCCEKFGICKLAVPESFGLFCHPDAVGTRTGVEARLCCKMTGNCDWEMRKPNPTRTYDRYCNEFANGPCMDMELMYKCCAEFGIGCEAKPCKGRPWWLEKCFWDSDCVNPEEFGICCSLFGKCSKPLCDSKWEPEGTEPLPTPCFLEYDVKSIDLTFDNLIGD